MNIRAALGCVGLLLFSFFSSSGFAQCSGGGSKPAWVDSPESISDEYFSAAGVSDSGGTPLSERNSSAKQNALKNLAAMIEVSVRNSLKLEQTRKESAGKVLTDSNLRSVTETSTSASLKNVETIATWEDPKSCVIWQQVRVSKQHVEQGKKEGLARLLFGILSDQLALAQKDSASLDTRLSAVDAALDVLPRIALELVPEASSAAYYSQQLKRIKKELGSAHGDLSQAKEALSSADLLVNKASEQTNEAAKSKSLGSAASVYRTLLAKHSNGLAPLFEAGDILFKLGEIEELRGGACGAKNYYQQSVDSKQINDRRVIAKKRAETLACSAADMEKTLWRQYFEGQPTVIICYYSSNSDRGVWHKACDGLNSIVRPLGADIVVKTLPLSPAQLRELQGGAIPASLGEAGKLVLGIIASGKMNNRVDHESPKRSREYQFEGGMATFLIENSKTIFSDRFQGTTGWNPISSQMVLDVLAINVVNRWREKFSKFLRHELDQ